MGQTNDNKSQGGKVVQNTVPQPTPPPKPTLTPMMIKEGSSESPNSGKLVEVKKN